MPLSHSLTSPPLMYRKTEPTSLLWCRHAVFITLLMVLLAPCAEASLNPNMQEMPEKTLMDAGIINVPLPAGKQPLAGYLEWLADPNNELSISQVQALPVKAYFKPLQGMPAFGYRKGAIWLRFTVMGAMQSDPYWLEIVSPFLDSVTLYRAGERSPVTSRAAGDHHPLSGRDVLYRNPVFELHPEPQKLNTYYLRIEGNNSLTFAIYLWSPPTFVEAIGLEQLAFGVFFAVHVILILTNLWFYQATREGSYGWFVLFTFLNLMTSAAAEGYGYLYLSWLQNVPEINEGVMIVAWMFSPAAGITFLFSYLGGFSSSLRPYLIRICLFYLMLASVFSMVILMLPSISQVARQTYQIWSLVSTLISLIIVLVLSIRRNANARLMLIAMLPYWIAVFMRFLRNMAIIPPGLLADNAYYLTMTFYLLVMNYGLSRHYQTMRERIEHAQREALSNSIQAERALEEKVIQRTSDLKRAVEQVTEALVLEKRVHEEQKQFFATVSHELRTPLAVIDMTAQNLERANTSDDEVVRARYEKILRATGRLSSLLDNYLDEDKFELLRHGANLSDCPIKSLLQDAMDSARLLSDQHFIQIDDEDLPSQFFCDPSLTRLALRTLADNAVKYTPPGSMVVLRGRQVADGVRIDVVDNGHGIALSERERIFERYYRGKQSGRQGGTGLGLALARSLIEKQGGTLTLTSDEGEGACFSVWLPSPEVRAIA